VRSGMIFFGYHFCEWKYSQRACNQTDTIAFSEDAMRSMEASGIRIAALKIPLITITVIGNQYRRATGRVRIGEQ
jgi:hypothetical protein